MNTFVNYFWNKKEDTIITAVDGLIDKLLPEKREWNIYSLLNYLDIVYRSVEKTLIEEALMPQPKGNRTIKKTSKYFIKDRYTIFNTGLVDKNNENIYFVKRSEVDEETNKFFYTEQEVTELGFDFKVDSIVNMLKDSFFEIFKDIDKINEVLINTEETCSEVYEKVKNEIEDIERIIEGIKEGIKDKEKNDAVKNIKRIKKELENRDYRSGTGWMHIIIDGSDNLPLPIINTVFGTSYSYIDKGNIRYQIIKEQERYHCIKGILIRALKRSLLMAKRDMTLIVPTLYPGKENDKKKLENSYLIPLYLMRSDKPDCVFLFNKENDLYVGKTLLNMEEASLNIRAFGNPEQYSWLRE